MRAGSGHKSQEGSLFNILAIGIVWLCYPSCFGVKMAVDCRSCLNSLVGFRTALPSHPMRGAWIRISAIKAVVSNSKVAPHAGCVD